jgi:hypothetical protein
MAADQWIIEAVGDAGRRYFFGPFADEDEAMGWGFLNLGGFEPEDWEQHELTLDSPEDNGSGEAIDG